MTEVLLTDAGLETVLLFHEGIDLPHFAAFPLLESDEGRAALRRYYEPFLRLAEDRGVGFVLSTPTWRANPEWGALLGYDEQRLSAVNRAAVSFLDELRAGRDAVVVEGCIGPRGDAYRPTMLMTADEAERYHAPQLRAFADSGCMRAAALTLTYVEEAVGIARRRRPGCRSSSASRWRRTGAFRAASRSRTRSSPWTERPAAQRSAS